MIHVYFTVAGMGCEQHQVLQLANCKATMMLSRGRKGQESVSGTPLETYVGVVFHDHVMTLYSYYGTSH